VDGCGTQQCGSEWAADGWLQPVSRLAGGEVARWLLFLLQPAAHAARDEPTDVTKARTTASDNNH
jgi:hypothetical protein